MRAACCSIVIVPKSSDLTAGCSGNARRAFSISSVFAKVLDAVPAFLQTNVTIDRDCKRRPMDFSGNLMLKAFRIVDATATASGLPCGHGLAGSQDFGTMLPKQARIGRTTRRKHNPPLFNAEESDKSRGLNFCPCGRRINSDQNSMN
mmetsp:Transcript_75389/g.161505  ORF Transcript_75389/g.161505 Transcript_75389/m.161505 type:complete len:148 (+) Transcript_75389:525-968(+)